MAKIIDDYDAKDIARIQWICNPKIVAWRVSGTDSGAQRPKPNISDPKYTPKYEKIWSDSSANDTQSASKEPRICLGTSHLIALVPPAARHGDVVVRFWNCDAAIVMRPIDTLIFLRPGKADPSVGASFLLVGRADVAEVIDPLPNLYADLEIPRKKRFTGGLPPGIEIEGFATGPVFVDLDLRTLQIITASINTYLGFVRLES